MFNLYTPENSHGYVENVPVCSGFHGLPFGAILHVTM